MPDTPDSPRPMLPARLPTGDVPKHYTWIAPVHDALALLVERRARARGLALAAVQDGERVLEVGVGTGLNLRHLLAANPSGWTEAVDLTPAMLRRARRRAERCGHDRWRLRQADARALPFDDGTFDLVVNSYMFDLLPEADFEPVLREFYRVLRPGGRVVMMNMTTPVRWHERVWDALYTLWPPLLGGCRGVEVAPAMRAAGFADVRRERISFVTFPSEVIAATRAG